MRNLDKLRWPAYVLVAMLLLFPVLDLSLQIWPFQLASAQWRFGSVGIVSRMLITPYLGLFLMFAVALRLEHSRILKIFTALSALVILVLVVLMGMFALDALEVRALVTAEQIRRFDLTSALALVKLSLASLVAFVFALVGMRSARAVGRVVKRKPDGPGIVRSELRDADPESA